jgi:hypothetical protein
MSLTNVSKFVFGENDRENFRSLVMKVVEGNVILCNENVFAWWLPRTSPMSEDGAWYKLKTIEYVQDERLWIRREPKSLWTKLPSPSPYDAESSSQHDIRTIVADKVDCCVVPMKDLLYQYDSGVDGHNFHMYVKDGPDICSVYRDFELVGENEQTMYSLMDNSIAIEPSQKTNDSFTTWTDVNYDCLQTENLIYPEDVDDQEPETPNPRNSSACRNLMDDFANEEMANEEFNNEEFNNNATMRLIEESYATDSDDYSESESYATTTESEVGGDEVATIVDGIPVDTPVDIETDDSEYVPSASESSASEYSEEDQAYYDSYDEWRQDVEGGWYTRRQFYDYYGSDEAWDNVDPSVFHKQRQDEVDGQFYTQEEFFQWYGTHDVWKKMHPKKLLMRRTLCSLFHYATYVHPNLQPSFICRMMATYE